MAKSTSGGNTGSGSGSGNDSGGEVYTGESRYLSVDPDGLSRGALSMDGVGDNFRILGNHTNKWAGTPPTEGSDETWDKFKVSYYNGMNIFVNGMWALSTAIGHVSKTLQQYAELCRQTEDVNTYIASNALNFGPKDEGSGSGGDNKPGTREPEPQRTGEPLRRLSSAMKLSTPANLRRGEAPYAVLMTKNGPVPHTLHTVNGNVVLGEPVTSSDGEMSPAMVLTTKPGQQPPVQWIDDPPVEERPPLRSGEAEYAVLMTKDGPVPYTLHVVNGELVLGEPVTSFDGEMSPALMSTAESAPHGYVRSAAVDGIEPRAMEWQTREHKSTWDGLPGRLPTVEAK